MTYWNAAVIAEQRHKTAASVAIRSRPVTAKEKREMQRLRVRIEELERQQQKDFDVYRDNLAELVEMRIALRNIHDALVDAVLEANRVIIPAIDKVGYRLRVMSQHTYDNAADWDKDPQF